MQMHKIRPKIKKKAKKRIGRGGKKGTYSGRGIKGQKSRAGRKFQPLIRETIKRFHKLRGYRTTSPGKDHVVLNLNKLEKFFASGDIVSPETLVQKRIIRKEKGRLPLVKILAKGSISKKLVLEDCLFSAKAREMVEKAGGKVKIKELPVKKEAKKPARTVKPKKEAKPEKGKKERAPKKAPAKKQKGKVLKK